MARKEPWWHKYKVDVPLGTSGEWEIDQFTIDENDAMISKIRSMHSFSDRGRVPVRPGVYTRLLKGRQTVMADTQAEILDHVSFIRSAYGDVLIHGLGLGVVTRACMLRNEVSRVTVVELAEDVIKLVGPWLEALADRVGSTLEIIHDDAFTWKPQRGAHWDCAWHDIWIALSEHNLKGMHRLHRRFGRRCDWQRSWGREQIEQRIRAEKARMESLRHAW